jgi:multimeric flavodoxin WrbA
MKILLINSSGRASGNTGRVMALFESALAEQAKERGIPLETERVDLARLSIQHCIGCRACFDRGEDACPLHDGLLSLYEKMRTADGYVIASPVYVEDVNGIMKTMIDRMAFLSHRPALYGKTALLYTTSGIGSSNHALNTMSTAFGTWGVKVARRMKFTLGALTPQEQIYRVYGKTIGRAADRFLSTLSTKPFRPSLYSLLAFSVQQSCWRKSGEPHDTVDYRYWEEAGWLKRGSRYYDSSMAKTPRAWILYGIGKIIALFFS